MKALRDRGRIDEVPAADLAGDVAVEGLQLDPPLHGHHWLHTTSKHYSGNENQGKPK